MNMRILPCMVTDEYVRGAGAVVGAAGSHDDVALQLAFNDTWKHLAKTITWLDAFGENPTLTILTADMLTAEETYIVPIPAPPKAHAGQMMMTIKGAAVAEDGTESAATMSATAYFEVLPSAWDKDAEEAQDIPATMAEQVHAEMVASVAKIEGMEVSAAEGAEAGVTKEVTETGIALHFTLPVGNLDEELSEQEELIGEQESLAKVIAETLAGKKAGGGSGEDGATFTPHMDADGNLSWTNDKGLPNPETVNIRGIPGDDYILTEADKAEIAEQAAALVDTALLAVIGTGEVSV